MNAVTASGELRAFARAGGENLFSQALRFLDCGDEIAVRRQQIGGIVFIAVRHSEQVGGEAGVNLFFHIIRKARAA